MSARAVGWIIEHPLTRAELARVRRRVIDGVEHHIATRETPDGAAVLGSWSCISSASAGVLALYYEATGDHPYGDLGIPLKHPQQLQLPGMPAPPSSGVRHAVPEVHKSHRG